MMEGDITVQKAAHYLYNKHPEVSTLYEYSPETHTIKVIAGEEHFLGKNSRVQVLIYRFARKQIYILYKYLCIYIYS